MKESIYIWSKVLNGMVLKKITRQGVTGEWNEKAGRYEPKKTETHYQKVI